MMNPNGTTIGPTNGTSFQVHPLLAPFWNFITDQQVVAILGGVVGFWGGVFGCGLIFLLLVAYRRWKKRRFNELNNPTIVEDGHPDESKQNIRDQPSQDQHATSPNETSRMRPKPTPTKIPNFQSRPKSPQPHPRPKLEGVSNKKKSHVANLPRLPPKPIPSITHTLH